MGLTGIMANSVVGVVNTYLVVEEPMMRLFVF